MKFTKIVFIWVSVISFILLLSSCASVNKMTVDADSNRQIGLQVGDVFLNESVKIKDLVVERNSAGNMIVNVLFKNQLYSKLNLQVKVEFYDADGVIIDDPWGYKPLVIEGVQEKWIKFVGISPNAKTYGISFKSPGK
jgi:uncharacterized protein YcfL